MSSIQERLQLKRVPLDTWNIREQLCLASAVVRSGDQNWMSVSRALKTVGEPNRPPDWYSQKSCAAQYGAQLEHVETPKRKKRSSEGAAETPQESIVKKLTQERIVEIQKTVAEMNQQYEKYKNEIAEARNPATTEERLREIWAGIETAQWAKERENARRAAWLKEREERRARADRTWRPPVPTSPATPPTASTPSSPLLTSLLKSSPVVTTPQHMPHPASVVDTVSPSVTAPTLSMLLEKSSNHERDKSSESNKHAAIEHIKSQLVQIEQQLKANNSPPAPLPAPSVDIDDIEIKAEDVYAFRDIDLHLPVAMHKGARPNEKSPAKKDQEETIEVETVDPNEDIKEEQMSVEDADDVNVDVEETIEETVVEETVQDVSVEPEVTSEAAVPFPAVKFPALEIKVVQETIKDKVKEEVPKGPEAEVVSQPEPEVVEVAPEDTTVGNVVEQEISKESPKASPPVDQPVEGPVYLPQDIPLPPEPTPEVVSEPLPPEPEEPSLPEPEPEVEEEPSPEVEDTEASNDNASTIESSTADDLKKDEDSEDSIPLKQMREDSLRSAELAADPAPEPAADPRPEPAADPCPEPAADPCPEPAADPCPEPATDPGLEPRRAETDDDTPMEVSREEEKDGKKRRDYSRKKKADSRACSGSESAAETSAPDSPLATDADRQHRLWKKSVMLVYSRLCAHKYASLFVRPISDEEAPGYSAVVKRPMDLSTIRRNIDNGQIRNTSEFQRDVLLMLSNALLYNSSEHSVYTMAREMHEEATAQLAILLAAQAHAGLEAPPRRKRRRQEEPRPAKRI